MGAAHRPDRGYSPPVLTLLYLTSACVAPLDSAAESGGDETGVDSGDSGDTADSAISTLPDEAPLAEVDVLVIGSGAGGLGAGWAAKNEGRSVLVIDRAATAGGATVNAGNYWAAGTQWQMDAGVADSTELALSEWNDFTGGDAASPVVQRFVEESASVLEWLVSLGAGFKLSSNVATDSGTVPREHQPSPDAGLPPVDQLTRELADQLLLETTATALVLDGTAVAGAWVTDAAGSAGWIHAGRVVVATGGFTRNDAIVLAAIPELADYPSWYESFPGMDGNGLTMAEAAGATTQNMDHLGLYAHGVEDAKIGQPEVMVLVGLDSAMVVDSAGHRVADEREFGSVSMGTRYLTEGPYYAIFDDVTWSVLGLQGRGFNYQDDPDGLNVTALEYETTHDVAAGDDGVALGADLGVDGAAIQAALDLYNADAATGTDTEFGKPTPTFTPLLAPPYRALPLVLGRSKSFGGLATNDDGEVVDGAGVVIPGLLAAGEACGFLGTTGIGYGFNGSVTAAWWSGLRAGASAAK
ncbi:hypothetical protein LBMAG42_39220 [Deltaproteobacteria bacterium]|nr:hypothetical protein LBMAG42_39220 [Deltaproteobacteria bacterium]